MEFWCRLLRPAAGSAGMGRRGEVLERMMSRGGVEVEGYLRCRGSGKRKALLMFVVRFGYWGMAVASCLFCNHMLSREI